MDDKVLETANPEEQLKKYKIMQTIGKGTFGMVKLGILKSTKTFVSIKILENDKMVENGDKIRAKREIDILKKLNHPNVVQIIEIIKTNDKYYIIMEYCEGGELFNYIVKKRRLSDEEASFFYYQIINGLDYIHSKGISHRDLKPENLLLGKQHLLKIIDFGLSNFSGDDLLSTPCGSPCYASPEMISGKKYDGFKIDIWSTGIILYAMLCGYLPFEDKDNEVLFEMILKGEIDYPYCLSIPATDLMKRILVNDPDKRITIKDIKKHKFYLKGKKIYNQKIQGNFNLGSYSFRAQSQSLKKKITNVLNELSHYWIIHTEFEKKKKAKIKNIKKKEYSNKKERSYAKQSKLKTIFKKKDNFNTPVKYGKSKFIKDKILINSNQSENSSKSKNKLNSNKSKVKNFHLSNFMNLNPVKIPKENCESYQYSTISRRLSNASSSRENNYCKKKYIPEKNKNLNLFKLKKNANEERIFTEGLKRSDELNREKVPSKINIPFKSKQNLALIFTLPRKGERKEKLVSNSKNYNTNNYCDNTNNNKIKMKPYKNEGTITCEESGVQQTYYLNTELNINISDRKDNSYKRPFGKKVISIFSDHRKDRRSREINYTQNQ